MKGELRRTLTIHVFNPCFNMAYRRGLLSIRQFQIGTPIIVHFVPDPHKNYFSLSRTSIDIPALRLHGVTHNELVTMLLHASREIRPQAPAGEALVACARCFGITWANTMNKTTHAPMRAICLQCGNEIKVLRLLHSAGHA